MARMRISSENIYHDNYLSYFTWEMKTQQITIIVQLFFLTKKNANQFKNENNLNVNCIMWMYQVCVSPGQDVGTEDIANTRLGLI